MKRKILLLFVMAPLFSAVYAQKTQKTTAYAITGIQKGQSGWTEVRLVDITTGDEVKSIYQSKSQVEVLNARTGKPVVKKEIPSNASYRIIYNSNDNNSDINKANVARKEALSQISTTAPVVIIDGKVATATSATPAAPATKVIVTNNVNSNVNTNVVSNVNKNIEVRKVAYTVISRVQTDKPFATTSAACAYDKKHERLYYTPMAINQLRYIDLKSGKIYYFEDEPFGKVSGPGDAANQITRMVIASDGDGYALTNDGNHLLRFTTGKKPEITDLGALTDDAGNLVSVHNAGGYGGDMIADAKKNLYLITANRHVFKISIDNKNASYVGAIKGLPKGFTTNGAIVEEGTKVIVSSSSSTQGYYRFDLVTLEGEKVSSGAAVFNASDLANGTLAFEKKKKEKKQKELLPQVPVVEEEVVADVENSADTKAVPKATLQEAIQKNSISVYPNPVTNGYVKLSFADQPAGKYQVQFMDVTGKIIKTQEVTINNKVQVEEFRLPALTAKGNYLVKIVGENNGVSVVNKLVVQ